MRYKISLSIIVLFACLSFFSACYNPDPIQAETYVWITIHFQSDSQTNHSVDTGGYFQDPCPGDEHKPWGNYVEAVRAEGMWRVGAHMESDGTPKGYVATIHSIWVNQNGPDHVVEVLGIGVTGRITAIEAQSGYSVTVSGSSMSERIRIRKAG